MRFDDAFANSKYLADGKYFPSRWAAKAEAFRESQGDRARLGLRYGTADREWFDLYLPKGTPEGLVVFIHGGFWLAFGPRDFSHLAAGAVERGWACAMPAYTLAPEARISEMTQQMFAALPVMAAEVAGPIIATGHSAGGQLSARMASFDGLTDREMIARLARVVPISPLSDLRPLRETAMQADLQISDAEAIAESPALGPKRPGVQVHVWVGGAERPRFLDQARRLGNAWSYPVTVDPGLHHFNVIEGLETPDSRLMHALLG
jgi:acetyl esterase/lipase